MSLDVTIPTSLLPILPVSVTGIPEKPCRIFASNTSPTVCRGLITTGSVMKPCSNFCREQTALSEILKLNFFGKIKQHPTQTFLPWPCALRWPEIQLYSCDELFQSRPSTERRTEKSQKPFQDLWNCHLSLWRQQQTDGTTQMLRCLCAVLVLTAMAMAMEDSVTVSMGDEMRGVFRVIFLVNADVRSSNLNVFGRWTRQDFMTLKQQ